MTKWLVWMSKLIPSSQVLQEDVPAVSRCIPWVIYSLLSRYTFIAPRMLPSVLWSGEHNSRHAVMETLVSPACSLHFLLWWICTYVSINYMHMLVMYIILAWSENFGNNYIHTPGFSLLLFWKGCFLMMVLYSIYKEALFCPLIMTFWRKTALFSSIILCVHVWQHQETCSVGFR